MGASWTAYTVIGVEITGKTNKVVVARNCDHPVRNLAKFCDECGKPITRTFTERFPEFSYDLLDGKPMRVIGTTDDKREFFGFISETDYDHEAVPFNTIGLAGVPELVDRVREQVEDYLNKIRPGFWDEVVDSYGIWTIMHCSY